MSQPPDYYKDVTHELELKYSFLGSFYWAVFCTQSGEALQLLKEVTVVKKCRNIKRFTQFLYVHLNTCYSNGNLGHILQKENYRIPKPKLLIMRQAAVEKDKRMLLWLLNWQSTTVNRVVEKSAAAAAAAAAGRYNQAAF